MTTLDQSIKLANVFTDVVLGALPQVQALVAGDGGAEAALVPLIGSILAQEGEQVVSIADQDLVCKARDVLFQTCYGHTIRVNGVLTVV